MKKLFNFIHPYLHKTLTGLLRKFSYIHIEEFDRPYIIKKQIEGVSFLFWIRDKHAKLWYDIYCTDPVWSEMRFIRDNLVKPGDTVIECGSHHGCTAILLANWITTKGQVHAFEPGINNYEILKDNILLNNIENIVPINKAVGDKDCVIKFAEFSESSMGSKVAIDNNEFNTGQSNTYNINQVSLDTLSVIPDFIKIDTQGYVFQPLLGAKTIIEERKPNLALEIDSRDVVNHYGNNFEKIFNLIDQNEYIYFIQFDGKEPEKIELSNILSEWKKQNNYSKEIHLYVKNTKK